MKMNGPGAILPVVLVCVSSDAAVADTVISTSTSAHSVSVTSINGAVSATVDGAPVETPYSRNGTTIRIIRNGVEARPSSPNGGGAGQGGKQGNN